jgi:hypothetical protein
VTSYRSPVFSSVTATCRLSIISLPSTPTLEVDHSPCIVLAESQSVGNLAPKFAQRWQKVGLRHWLSDVWKASEYPLFYLAFTAFLSTLLEFDLFLCSRSEVRDPRLEISFFPYSMSITADPTIIAHGVEMGNGLSIRRPAMRCRYDLYTVCHPQIRLLPQIEMRWWLN